MFTDKINQKLADQVKPAIEAVTRTAHSLYVVAVVAVVALIVGVIALIRTLGETA